MPAELAAECRDVVQVYPSAGGAVVALRGITAAFPVGSVSVVMGPSGAGKSTLLRLLACLEPPAAGEVLIAGAPTSRLAGRARRRLIARHIGYVFQRPAQNLLDYVTVAGHVTLAGRMRDGDTPTAVDDVLVAAALESVADLRPHDLTPGEQQRLAFAMAVVGAPALVVADEPTAELDPDGASALAALLPTLVERGQTFVVASHDPTLVAAADQVLVVRHGTLAAHGTDGGELLATIDDAGRLALPDDAVVALAARRVRVVPDDDDDGGGDGFRVTRA